MRKNTLWGATLHVERRFMLRDASRGETLRERNRFVCTLVLGKTRTAFNANLWGIWNGCVCLRVLSL